LQRRFLAVSLPLYRFLDSPSLFTVIVAHTTIFQVFFRRFGGKKVSLKKVFIDLVFFSKIEKIQV